MTQIQLRRDTSANWTSVNPVLASGEPAFETDTGKFKIGDGTTAYNSLDYIGDGGEAYTLPPATADTLGGIKVGTNLSITEDGTLSATSSTPSNMMTTNTAQYITGNKTFNNSAIILPARETTIVGTIKGYYSNGYVDIVNPKGSTYSGPCFGDVTRVTRLESSSNAGIEVVADKDTSATSNIGRVIHTVNMLDYIIAGDNISITETGTGRDRQMIISSTGGSTPTNIVTTSDSTPLVIWKGTQSAYDGITTKDENTLYIITGA